MGLREPEPWRFWREWDPERCFVMFGAMAPSLEWRPCCQSDQVEVFLLKISVISLYSHILHHDFFHH